MLYVIPVIAVCALLFAVYLAFSVKKEEEGTDRMKEIAGAIREGANAFLFSEYKVLVIFAAVLFVVIGVGIGNWITAVCFLIGAIFSTLAGFFGMRIATDANVRTANAARTPAECAGGREGAIRAVPAGGERRSTAAGVACAGGGERQGAADYGQAD